MMLSVPVSSIEELEELEERGIDLTRVLAWTGTDEPDAALNVALAQRGVETAFGTLGDWDRRFEREGGDQYAAFAETGLTVISTDRPVAAVRDVDAHDGEEGFAALRCLGE
jgi:glycerophosphoryl diester phosphodiesterase